MNNEEGCFFSCILLLKLIIMSKVAIQRNKKMGSQKEIKGVAPLLSQLYIELPKPHKNRKISLVNQREHKIANQPESIRRLANQQSLKLLEKNSIEDMLESKEKISSIAKVKSLSTLPNIRSEKEIIREWIRTLFLKKNLLGSHWEQKLKIKKMALLKRAFNCLKEEQEYLNSHFLQTQSKHKPYMNKQNHMITLGLEKCDEVVQKVLLKSKRAVFSTFLRFLAFQYSQLRSKPNANDLAPPQQQLTSASHKIFQKIQEISPKNIHFVKPVIFQQSLHSKQPAKSNDYHVLQENQVRTPIKQVQSPRNLPFAVNEYALTPATPIKEQFPHTKKTGESNLIVSDGLVSKFSDRNKASQELVNSRSQPHISIGGIGGNFKYQFNQHNYIVVQPQQYYEKVNNLFPNPPSPMSHQIAPNIKFQSNYQLRPTIFQQMPVTFSPQCHTKIQNNFQRRVNARPLSHNPVISHQNQQMTASRNHFIVNNDKVENRKSRALSAANIKICFSSKEEATMKQSVQKGSDYHEDEKVSIQNANRLGTLENKQLRRNFQVNSYGNQLVPRAFPNSTQLTNYIYSTPASPLPQDPHPKNIQINYIHPNLPSPTTPMPSRSPKGPLYQSFTPISQQSRQQAQQTRQFFPFAHSPYDNSSLSNERLLLPSGYKLK